MSKIHFKGGWPINQTSYEIDFNKVTTIEDIKLILEGMLLEVTSSYVGFEGLEHLLKVKEEV
jgi:hypothetical protein